MSNSKNKYFLFLISFLLTTVFFQCNSKKEIAYKNFTYNENYTSKTNPERKKSNVLYLLNGKEISSDIMKEIDPESIASINVIKDTEGIKKYTQEKYDGIILIHLKKTIK